MQVKYCVLQYYSLSSLLLLLP